MKKLLQLFTLAIAVSFMVNLSSCGSNQQDEATREKEARDSVEKIMQEIDKEVAADTAGTLPEPLQEESTPTKESEEAPK